MYLYQDLNRRPSTIDGYRTAIVDTLGPAGHHIAQSSDLHRLLSSFHRDRSKSSRNLPKWNFYCVNTSYPMDNILNRSAQTGPPNVRKRRLVFPPAGRSSHCTRQVACRTSFLSRQPDVIASFSFGAYTACT